MRHVLPEVFTDFTKKGERKDDEADDGDALSCLIAQAQEESRATHSWAAGGAFADVVQEQSRIRRKAVIFVSRRSKLSKGLKRA